MTRLLFVAVLLLSGSLPALPAAAFSASDTRPALVLLHGYNPFGIGVCRGSFPGFNTVVEQMQNGSGQTVYQEVKYVAYYAYDRPSWLFWTECNDDSARLRKTDANGAALPGWLDATRDTTIAEIARSFAAYIRDRYTNDASFTGKVDVLAHSMGGVIVRYAALHYPSFFRRGNGSYVLDDVVLVGSPHQGATAYKDCDWFGNNCRSTCTAQDDALGARCWLQNVIFGNVECVDEQCTSMLPGSTLLSQLPTALPGWADWTLVGSTLDHLASADSALYPQAQHEYRFYKTGHFGYFDNGSETQSWLRAALISYPGF